MQSVKFTREKLHWRELVQMAVRRSTGRWPLIIFFISAIVSILVYEFLDYCQLCGVDRRSFLFGVCFSIIVLSADSIYKHFAVGMQTRKGGTFLGRHEVLLGPSGVEVVGSSYRSTYHWKAFDEATVGKGLIVLWCDNVLGVSIPRSAFSNSDDEQRFKKFADEHIALERQLGATM